MLTVGFRSHLLRRKSRSAEHSEASSVFVGCRFAPSNGSLKAFENVLFLVTVFVI